MVDTTEIKNFLKSLKELKSLISKDQSKNGQIQKAPILNAAEQLAKLWFDDHRPKLVTAGFSEENLIVYDNSFKHLLKLSNSKGNQKKSFLSNLKNVTQSFSDDIILKLHTHTATVSSPFGSAYDQLLIEIQDPDKSVYLKEAMDCAKHGFLRAAIVLGWCAAIDQIHNAIEKNGFTQFNVASVTMASAQSGRFKKYNDIFKITSISELREVFDNKILWVLEGMGMIDINQHTRLKSCFDMRNHCAHPGEAPITPYNMMSFFSDINEIVFKNPKMH